MAYTKTSKLDPELSAKEIELLNAGYNYVEISQKLGAKNKNGIRRNTAIYQIDVQKAFKARIIREGFPCDLNVSDSFGGWFAGILDGEGCLQIIKSGPRPERRVGVSTLGCFL